MPYELSSETHARLTAEVEQLRGPWRVEIARRIEEARALGDLSENGDYHAAKDEQGNKEARLRDIEALLKDAEVVEPPTDGTVGVLSTVTIDWGGGDLETFLVGMVEERVDGGPDILTPDSALGIALIEAKAKAGDQVSYTAPNGRSLTVTVAEVA